MRSMCHVLSLTVLTTGMLLSQPPLANAQATRAELAGNALSQYPFFEAVRAFNHNASVNVAIDPTRFPSVVGETCDIYIVAAKSAAQWATDPSLTDVRAGGAQTELVSGTNIQGNTFQVAGPSELNADAGTGLGVGYDVVLDVDQNGTLNSGDFIDGLDDTAGLYIVHDTTTAGPLAVTTLQYNLDSTFAATFGIPSTRLAEALFYPTNIAALGELPIVIVSHGNGHQFSWYNHIGSHLASYGYIVMSHDNNTGPGPNSAATTTLGHTDAFIELAETGAVASGDLAGHLDTNKIVWIGHSRGAEGVAIAYDRLFDNTHTPVHFSKAGIKLISSMLPTDFEGTDVANPHDANYHLWTASGDSDVDGSAGCELCQTFHLHDRATHCRQSTVVQGTGHAWFHNGPESPGFFTGPASIGPTNDLTHAILLGHLLPLVKHYVEDNVPALDFLTRQYESFRPIGVPTGNPNIVVTHEYRGAAPFGDVIIDDYQSQFNTAISSSGGSVFFDVENVTEGLLNDNNSTFAFSGSDAFNGATQVGETDGFSTRNDDSRGVVFDWTDADRFYEWRVPTGQSNLTDNLFVSLRSAQVTQHPNTLAALEDLTFSLTLRDVGGTSSSINIGAYGGGIEQPYQRDGGWHNEMETIRIRLTDFLNNGSGLDLGSVVAIRLDVGPSWGSSRGRLIVDDLMLTNDLPTSAPPAPLLRISETVLNYRDVELGFAFSKALVLHNDGTAPLLNVSVALATPAGDVSQWSTNELVTNATIAPNAAPIILRQTFEPLSLGSQLMQLVVTSNDPSTPVQPIVLTGTGVAPIPVDTILVLDRSGSMSDPAGDRIKIEALRDAAMLYTDLLREDIGGTGTGDKIGFWKYNHQNSDYLTLNFITEPIKNSIAANELSSAALTDTGRLRPTGSTGIGGAMQNAAAQIGGPIADRKQVLVVLTDGIENVSPYINNVIGPIQAGNPSLQLYSVGLGSNIEADKLQDITNMGTEGYHQVSDALTGESLYDLETFYFKIFSNATGMDLVVDPTHVVNLNSQHVIIVDTARIVSSDRRANFLVLDDPALRPFYDLEFVSPKGDVIVPGVTIGGIPIQQFQRNSYTIYRIIFPDIRQADTYVGDWTVRLKPNGKWSPEAVKRALAKSRIRHSSFINPYKGLIPVGFAAAVASNYKLEVSVLPNSHRPGAEVTLRGKLSDRGWPALRGKLNVTVTTPASKKHSLTLYDDGTHGDPTPSDGEWSNRFTATESSGVYKFHFISTGENTRGELAPREATRYLTLQHPRPTPQDDECCERLIKMLEGRGLVIDPRRLDPR